MLLVYGVRPTAVAVSLSSRIRLPRKKQIKPSIFTVGAPTDEEYKQQRRRQLEARYAEMEAAVDFGAIGERSEEEGGEEKRSSERATEVLQVDTRMCLHLVSHLLVHSLSLYLFLLPCFTPPQSPLSTARSSVVHHLNKDDLVFRSQLDLSRLLLAGHSFGGATALTTALRWQNDHRRPLAVMVRPSA